MWTEHSGNFWTLTTHKPVRTLHKILLQSPVLERSVWAQIILTSVHLLCLKWSSWEVWCWPFAWNASSSSDCSTKTQRPSAPRHSPKSRSPNFSVCSCWVCFQLSWEAATMASPFAQNTAGLPRRARHREQEGSPRKAISMYMTSAPSQVWPHCMRSGAQGNNTPSTRTLIFWKPWKSLGREKWEKIKCLSLQSYYFSGANKCLYLYLNLYINIHLHFFFTVCIQFDYTWQ